MTCSVLGIGYPLEEHDFEREKWSQYGIVFEFASTPVEIENHLRTNNYACIIVCTDHISSQDMASLRNICLVPVIIMPSKFSTSQRWENAVYSVIQYIHAAGLSNSEHLDKSAIQDCFKPVLPDPKPLTIITAKDISVCVEKRSVEICGCEIHLTAKEFNILTLLICNQNQVFTHEMIISHIWNEDSCFYSRKIVATHISNIRRKIQTASNSANYIQSVHGVGYKFNANG